MIVYVSTEYVYKGGI